MRYLEDETFRPVLRSEPPEDPHKNKPRHKRVLSGIFNSRNAFVGLQLAATLALAASGYLSGNHGRMTTGIGNSIKNSSWFVGNNISRLFGKNALREDVSQTRANGLGALISAGTNAPQFVMNLAPVFAGAAAGVAWGDIIGAGVGIAAYLLMAVDQYNEQRRLREFEDLAKERYPDQTQLFDLYDMDRRNHIVGYRERGEKFKDLLFNKLPSTLLIARGLTFTFTGAAAAAQGLTAGSALFVAAGVLFTYGAFREYKRQNAKTPPPFKLLKPASEEEDDDEDKNTEDSEDSNIEDEDDLHREDIESENVKEEKPKKKKEKEKEKQEEEKDENQKDLFEEKESDGLTDSNNKPSENSDIKKDAPNGPSPSP